MRHRSNQAALRGKKMNSYTTAWDRSPTDAELESFYGKDKPHAVHDEIVETLTETVRAISVAKLGLPYAKCEKFGDHYTTRKSLYPLVEVITDYGSDNICHTKGGVSPLAALIAVIEKSDCPLVAAYRKALAERFAEGHADEVEELS
jgi:hypothetical protein